MGVNGIFVSWALLLIIIFPLALIGLLVLFLARKNNPSRDNSTVRPALILHQKELDPVEEERIQAMVESGKISREEGDELIEALKASSKTVKCPYCAEEVSPRNRKCPECDSDIIFEAPNQASSGRQRKSAPRVINGILIVYMLVVGALILVFRWPPNQTLLFLPMKLMAVMAITSAILMIYDKKLGWYLGIIWSCLQIVLIYMSFGCLNKQFFVLQYYFLFNGNGIGINLVGIILLVLFIIAGKESQKNSDDYGKGLSYEYDNQSQPVENRNKSGCFIALLIGLLVLAFLLIAAFFLMGVRTVPVSARARAIHTHNNVRSIP
jgi:hypothetical protein